jgi:hypothetical protein
MSEEIAEKPVEEVEQKIEEVKAEIIKEEEKPVTPERDERLDRLEKKLDDLYDLLLSIVPAKAETVIDIPPETKPEEKVVENKDVKAEEKPMSDEPTEKKKRRLHFV